MSIYHSYIYPLMQIGHTNPTISMAMGFQYDAEATQPPQQCTTGQVPPQQPQSSNPPNQAMSDQVPNGSAVLVLPEKLIGQLLQTAKRRWHREQSGLRMYWAVLSCARWRLHITFYSAPTAKEPHPQPK